MTVSKVATRTTYLTVRSKFIRLEFVESLFGGDFTVEYSIPGIACIYRYSKVPKLLSFG